MARIRIALVGALLLATVALAPLQTSTPALAVVHLAEIHEVMSGFNGNPNVQYVEVNMRSIGQNLTNGARLSAFTASGAFIDGNPMMMGNQPILTVSGNVANSGDGVRWLIGTTQFEAAAGIQADFEFPMSPGLPAGPGLVCLFEPLRDFTNPSQSIDCVAYGGAGFTGSNPNSSPSEAALDGPGDCERSLTRINPSTLNFTVPWALSDDANDFALMTPSPENNAGGMGTLTATPDTDGDTEADCRDDDDDGDGVLDVNDNCRVIANLDQTDGDGDGAGAVCDPDDTIVDFDQDGCADGEEQDHKNQLLGGKRDATLFWDFFDTPDAAGNRDKVVSVQDISRVVARFGSSTMPPLSKPDALTQALSAPPPAPAYHAGFDRTSPMAGQGGWQTNMPNSSVSVQDISLAVGSFGHSCAAAP
jgi:hypothetical protein